MKEKLKIGEFLPATIIFAVSNDRNKDSLDYAKFHPVILEFKELIDKDPIARMYIYSRRA